MSSCSLACRIDVARVLCNVLEPAVDPAATSAEVISPATSLPLLRAQARRLLVELGCTQSKVAAEADDSDHTHSPPALLRVGVENGKSGSAFMVPGGRSVDASDGAVYHGPVLQLDRHGLIG